MAKEQHTETYLKAHQKFRDILTEAGQIEKQADSLKVIMKNLLAKAEEDTLLRKLKKRISGETEK